MGLSPLLRSEAACVEEPAELFDGIAMEGVEDFLGDLLVSPVPSRKARSVFAPPAGTPILVSDIKVFLALGLGDQAAVVGEAA